MYEDLDTRNLSAKWVPKCLNADSRRQRLQSSEQLLEFFRRDPNDFLSRLVTMDETWLYHYDSRQSNNQWSVGIAAHPTTKNCECKYPLEKFSPASIFWDQDGILLIDFLVDVLVDCFRGGIFCVVYHQYIIYISCVEYDLF